MEFEIGLRPEPAELGRIEQAIQTLDPAGVVAIDPQRRLLRVAAAASEFELAALLARAGFPVAIHHIRALPSVCCGGCGG